MRKTIRLRESIDTVATSKDLNQLTRKPTSLLNVTDYPAHGRSTARRSDAQRVPSRNRHDGAAPAHRELIAGSGRERSGERRSTGATVRPGAVRQKLGRTGAAADRIAYLAYIDALARRQSYQLRGSGRSSDGDNSAGRGCVRILTGIAARRLNSQHSVDRRESDVQRTRRRIHGAAVSNDDIVRSQYGGSYQQRLYAVRRRVSSGVLSRASRSGVVALVSDGELTAAG